MKQIAIGALMSLAIVCHPLGAQVPGAPGPDPLHDQIVPPELILQQQKAIGLTEAQRSAVINEVKRVQTRMVDLQWDLQQAVQRMAELLGQSRIEEAAAVAQLDKVLSVEREIKQMHIVLAVRLKNLLTPEQQQKLNAARGSPPR